MNHLSLKRIYQDDCTIGIINYKHSRFTCLELPWLSNQKNISCIPEGVYAAAKHYSAKNGECIEIYDVIGRSNIQIHSGNFTSDIEGCILVGDSIKDINNDGILDVANSKASLSKLLKELPDAFYIVIEGV